MPIWRRIEQIFRTFRARNSLHREIRIGDGGFELYKGDIQKGQINWRDVAEIRASKRDSGAVDQICLDFGTGDSWTTVTEDDSGWKVLLDEIERRFSIDPIWRQTIWRPAFAENLTQLYSRREPTLELE